MKLLNKILLLLVLSIAVQAQGCVRMNFLPMPTNLNCGLENVTLADPCKILYHIQIEEHNVEHIHELIKHQQKSTFFCKIPNIIFGKSIEEVKLIGFSYQVNVSIEDYKLKSAFTTKEQSYSLNVQKSSASITAPTYVGFVRALETFMQSLECPRGKYKNCTFINLPLNIADEPAFVYRGLMIDSSRHFLPLKLILQTIDAMMYNKLSVLHWHIVDEDSFPLILESHPEIAKFAAYSEQQTYTAKQARQVVRYAMVRGIRVVPELDTPGHAASWGLAPQNKGVACTFGQGFMGPLDVTLQKTYKLVREVFAEIINIFPDPIIHLGGDEVVLTCLTNKTQFLEKEGIKEHQIERHYRRKQHKIIKQLDGSKKPMYWMNTNQIQIEEGDIIHWWGGGLPTTRNPLVISQYGPFYLDMGVGNYLGVSYGNYQTWLDLYNQYIGKMIEGYPNKDNVLGAEVCLWSELSNQYIHHMKIWIRSSAFAERVWTVKNYNPKPDVLGRLAAFQRLLHRRGIPTSGATSEQCETHPQFC